jgi:hypothetical protein
MVFCSVRYFVTGSADNLSPHLSNYVVILSESEESITDYDHIRGYDSIPEQMLHYVQHDKWWSCYTASGSRRLIGLKPFVVHSCSVG